MRRLKTREQFQAVLASATVARTTHFAMHRLASDDAVFASSPSLAASPPFSSFGEPWLGALVPKRWAKRAVTRNLIKRQIYSAASDYEAQLPLTAHVVRMRSGFDRRHFISAASDRLKVAVRTELEQLFRGALAAKPQGGP